MNQRIVVTAVPEFAAGDPRSRVARDPNGSAGPYLVHFIFAVPGKEMFRGNVDMTELFASGESLLRTSTQVSAIRIDIASAERKSAAALNVKSTPSESSRA
jgi:hypothetical protein